MVEVTQQIKEKLDVVEVIRRYLELAPAGKNFKARCPFHHEKTPSLMVSPERQSWHCFGCNAGGDIFTFVMKYENVEFFEALKLLAEQAGVEIRRASPEQQRQFGVLYDINEAAKNFFRDRLKQEARVIEYLQSRRVKGETAAEFELGVSPSGWDETTVYLLKRGFEINDIVRAGIAGKSDKGTYYDRFRGRIMFPIMNHAGKTVGFSGRLLPEAESETAGKYINSPETPIFSKSRILYGFNKTKTPVREAGRALLVEGQMDLIMAYQEGVKNVVASSGTALTSEHLRALKRVAQEVIFNFDNDAAGEAAGERAIDLAAKEDLAVRVLVLRGVKDVAELAAERPGELRRAIEEETVPAMEFYFRKYLVAEAMKEIRSKKEAVRLALGKIMLLPSAVEREEWQRELSRRTGLSEGVLKEEMENGMGGEQSLIISEGGRGEGEGRKITDQNGGEESWTRAELISQRLLSAALAVGVEAIGPWREFMPPNFSRAAAMLVEKREPEDNEIKQLIDLIYLRSGLMEGERVDDLGKQLKIEFLKSRRQEYFERVCQLEKEKKKGHDLEEALQEFNRISKQLNEAMTAD